MSPTSNTSCTEVLRRLVVQNLSLFLYDNAKFFAERLYYEDPKPENLHLLGQSYFRQGKIKQTYLILQHSDWATNRYLFALSCISLGKYSEAERALISPSKAKAFQARTTQLKDLESVPGGAAGLYLLGIVSRKEQRRESAIDYFQKSLQLDPAMWGSINELSEMGVAVDSVKLYGMDSTAALRVLCSEEPSVAIGSVSSVMSSNESLHQEHDTENYSTNTSNNDSERHRVAVIERRRMAESRCDASAFSPRTAMSLGLSSLSLRIPFATPGSMSYPLPAVPDYSQYGIGYSVDAGRATSPVNHSIPSGATGSYTDMSTRSTGCPGNDESSRSLALFDAEMRPKSARIALFEKSVVTPGLTPAPASREPRLSTTGLTPGCRDLTLKSAHSPGSRSSRATPTASSSEFTGDESRGNGIDDDDHTRGWLTNRQLEGDAVGYAPVSGQLLDQRLLNGGLPPRRGFRDSMISIDGAGMSAPSNTGGGGRRVSFGPTARLSFSSLGRGMGGTGAGIFGEGDGDHDNSKLASTAGAFQGAGTGGRDGNLLDEHPIKFQRCLDREGTRRHSEQSTPGDLYDYHDPCGGLNPDTPYVRGYSASDAQWQGGRSGGGAEGLELDGPGSVSPIAHAVTPFMTDRESAELPSFSTTVDNKPNRTNDNEENRENGGKEGDNRHRDKERGGRNLRSNPRSPGDDSFDIQSNNRNLFKDGYDNIGPDSVNQRDQSHGDEWDYQIQKNKNGIKNQKKGSDDQFNNGSSSSGGVEKTLSLLTVCANAYQLLCMYRCRECIALLHRLPRQHYLCGWVQHMLGKAYCEVNEYQPAVLALREMQRLEPFRAEGTETLSTALWHLKKDTELCSLATQVVEVDKFCPETWCVVGNCFSLQREPEIALKYFTRALQIDPGFTYAHTLCGHELANNEDLDKAVQAFRNSLLHDDRHYNAWYGLGSIYFRQEKFEMAEYHFRRALAINAVSSVLRCYLSMALHAQNDDNKSFEALDVLIQACKVDPKNPQLQYQRAHVLLALGHYEDAIETLDLVLTLAPKEPPVYSLLGQVHRTLGHTYEALKYFNMAISLDPKQATALKAILESIEEPLESDGIMNGYMD